MQCGFHFNAYRCTGCKTCVLACKDAHDLPNDVSFRQVYEFGGGSWTRHEDGSLSQDTFTYHVSVACNHCSRPACAQVCPTGAMHKDERGLMSVDTQRCIGCGYCALSCPYRAPKVDRNVGHSVKCDGCTERVAEGLAPICVEACPLRVLDFGPVEDLVARYGSVHEIPPLPEASATSSNLVVTPPVCLEKDPQRVREEGAVLNIREIV